MRGLKILLGSAALFAGLALAPATQAQISLGINIGGPPPVCPYGYFEYPPYQCAPYGFYGPGYFYNGIFLGVGPWSNWGYNHGWGGHRFNGGGGGRYVAGRRDGGGRPAAGRANNRGGASHEVANRGGASHATAARSGGASHANTAHTSGGAAHASASHASSRGGASHGGGGGEEHGGGGHR